MIYGLINCYTASGEIFKEVESIGAKEDEMETKRGRGTCLRDF